MKIVYISNSIIPSRTANSIHVMKMCQAFADNGHEVVLLAPHRHNEYESSVNDVYEYYGVRKNFEVLKLYYGKVRYVKTIMYGYLASKKAKELKPDLVYGRDLYGCYFSAKKYNTIFEAHAPMGNFVNRFMLSILDKQKKYIKTVVISEALKKIISNEQKISADRFFVAHDGADEVVDFESKAQLLGDKSSLKVGYVGHLYRGRGIELIIECAKNIKYMSFHIVGGTDEDIAHWEKQIEKLNINNIYFYGFVSPKEAIYYRNAFDIVLAPYAKQVSVAGNTGDTSKFMSPLKIFEYMANKKAIICSDLLVLREILNDTNSKLVDAEDNKEWINAIEKLKDDKIRNELAWQAYKDFIQEYSWKRRSKNLVELLNE